MAHGHSGPTPERYFDTITAYQKSAAMQAALETGLFTAIGEGHRTVEKLAAKCQVSPHGARILADYMTILGFLRKEGASYVLAEDAALFLDRNSPAYLGASVEFLRSQQLSRHFEQLTERVRHGGAPRDGDNSLIPHHDMWVRFARGMAGLMMMPAQLLAKYVLENVESGAARDLKILDIAAGHGIFGLAFLQQNKQARVVGQDWPSVLAVATENAGKLKVADRYTTLAGDAFAVDFGTGYDIVLIPNFLHHFDRATNVTLLKKVLAALKPGGMAATLEFAPEEDRVTPPGCGAFALVMLASTPAGDAYTLAELTAMYKDAGFSDIRTATQPIGMQRAITGMKSR